MFEFLKSFQTGLSRTKENIIGKIRQTVGLAAKIDADLFERIEEILIQGDVGTAASAKIIANLKETVAKNNLKNTDDILAALKSEILQILATSHISNRLDTGKGLIIWLIIGVNGTGKTTSVGKLAAYFRSRGQKVMIAACDTFRAAAVDQLAIWAERSGVDFIRAKEGTDPAAIAFDAASAAKSRGIDILLIDTAGRLHTKSHLMEELKKIRRVLTKVVPEDSIAAKLVLDGTTGQNALSQAKLFAEAVGHLDGLFITKLDGTAKGGIVVAIAQEMAVPIDFVGLGEQIDDLKPFDAQTFVEALFA